MSVMSVVVSHDAPVVASMDVVIDIGEVVPSNLPGDLINPYFPALIFFIFGGLLGIVWAKVHDNQMGDGEIAHRED